MRTLMLILSVMIVGGGIFCVANGSVAFISVAFVIGMVLLILGVIEVIVGLRADFNMPEKSMSLTKDGILLAILALVILSGVINDDTSAQILFAVWLVIEGVVSFDTKLLRTQRFSIEEKFGGIINFGIFLFGIFLFYNTSLFHINATLLIGITMMLLGLKRYSYAYAIDYVRPSFVTGNQEKLYEAKDEERRATEKAKAAIREQKNARRRIAKIEEDIAAEQDAMNAAANRRRERNQERQK